MYIYCKGTVQAKVQYDKKAKAKSYKISDRVMVYMPYEATGKDRKPYHGPYRIIDACNNCLLPRPVDKPNNQLILVNMDRVSPFGRLFLVGTIYTQHQKHEHIYSPTLLLMPTQPADHQYSTKSRTKLKV